MTVLGVIAEGDSDVAVVEGLARKITRARLAIPKAVGHRSGRSRKRTVPWTREVHREGCTHLMLVCNLDGNGLPELSARFTKALESCQVAHRVVVIRVHEIEAWLLADYEAINKHGVCVAPCLETAREPEVPRPCPDARVRRHYPPLLTADYGERAWCACPYAAIAGAVAANSRSS
jgi:hypothetical protein